jgi:hypothetical protein
MIQVDSENESANRESCILKKYILGPARPGHNLSLPSATRNRRHFKNNLQKPALIFALLCNNLRNNAIKPAKMLFSVLKLGTAFCYTQ